MEGRMKNEWKKRTINEGRMERWMEERMKGSINGRKGQ